MSEPLTFNIIENYEPVVDYEEFKKDFLDVNTRVPDLKEKYKLSRNRWRRYRDMVFQDCNITRKPVSNYHNAIINQYYPDRKVRHNMEFIQEKINGFHVVKSIHYKRYYFGRYATLECAQKIRDILLENNWDLELGNKLRLKYGLDRWKPAKHKALLMYDEFEELYLYSDMLILDIYEKLGLTSKMYGYLLSKIHENYGKHSRNIIRSKNGSKPIPKKKRK